MAVNKQLMLVGVKRYLKDAVRALEELEEDKLSFHEVSAIANSAQQASADLFRLAGVLDAESHAKPLPVVLQRMLDQKEVVAGMDVGALRIRETTIGKLRKAGYEYVGQVACLSPLNIRTSYIRDLDDQEYAELCIALVTIGLPLASDTKYKTQPAGVEPT